MEIVVVAKRLSCIPTLVLTYLPCTESLLNLFDRTAEHPLASQALACHTVLVSPWVLLVVVARLSARTPEDERPPHTPNSSSTAGAGQQRPPASRLPAQHAPALTQAAPLASHLSCYSVHITLMGNLRVSKRAHYAPPDPWLDTRRL